MADRENLVLEGALPVLVTPFKGRGRVDEDSLLRQLDFCVEAGSKGVVFGWGSESQMLTDAERERLWTASVKHLNDQIPVVVATSHPSCEVVVALTRLARWCGADCAMVHPEGQRGDGLVSLFVELTERAEMPLMIQDATSNAPADVLLKAVQEAKQVVSLKLESGGAPHKMGLVAEGLKTAGLHEGDRRVTVLGGSNGGLLMEELERGSVGSLPHPAVIDAFGSVCDAFAAGDHQKAKSVYYETILPLNRWTSAGGGAGGGIWLHKTIFERAGILETNICRVPATPQPDWVMEKVWAHLKASDLLIGKYLKD